MSNQQGARQAQGAQEGRASSTPSLPNLNAETYPFAVVQHLINEAAIVNTYAAPDSDRTGYDARALGARGLELSETLRRFDANVRPPDAESGVRAANIVGEPIGQFRHRWQLAPDDFVAAPGREPAATALDTSRSQRFVMQDGVFTFGDGADGFRGFATGRTYPVRADGRQRLLAAAVGEVMDGHGRFKDLEGSYVLSGELTQSGFRGNVQCRVIDQQGQLRSTSELPSIERSVDEDAGLTYIYFRGQKRDENVRTEYIFGPGGQPQGFKLWQELRVAYLNSVSSRRRGLRSSDRLGRVIGRMTSQVFLNILSPGAPGNSLAPIPFSSYNEFTFLDDDGNAVGSFVAEGGEGRTFNVQLKGVPGQQALRF